MSHRRPAPAPPIGLGPNDRPPRRRLWPFVSGGVIAGLVVVALDLQVTTNKQIRLTLFNEELWLVPG